MKNDIFFFHHLPAIRKHYQLFSLLVRFKCNASEVNKYLYFISGNIVEIVPHTRYSFFYLHKKKDKHLNVHISISLQANVKLKK